MAKRNSMRQNSSDEDRKDVKADALNTIVIRNIKRNYEILKNSKRMRFQS